MENKSNKKQFNYNYLSVIFIYVVAGAFLKMTPQIKDPTSRWFPYLIGSLAVVLATVVLIKNIFNLGKKEEPLDFSNSGIAFVMAGLLFAYVMFIELVGFYIATPFYLYITMWVLGQKSKKIMFAISLLFPLGVYIFFEMLLNMEIPQGILLPMILG